MQKFGMGMGPPPKKFSQICQAKLSPLQKMLAHAITGDWFMNHFFLDNGYV